MQLLLKEWSGAGMASTLFSDIEKMVALYRRSDAPLPVMRISDHTLNRLNVVKAILRHGPVARTELPEWTGLSAGLITQLTAELVRGGLVNETRDTVARMGRPRTLLELNGDGPVVIGASIDWSATVEAAFVNLSGKVLHVARLAYPAPASLEELAGNIGQALAQAIAQGPLNPERIARAGIALPALIDSARGEVHFGTTFPVVPTAFAGPISGILGIPVTIENEMDCLARAEHWFGRASREEDFTIVRVGHSIDSAEFANGVPKSGANGLSTSFGHVKMETGEHALGCYCGASGCLTAYSSGYGILKAAGRLSDLPFPPVAGLDARFEEFAAQASRGENVASAAFTAGATYLGIALGNYLNTVNPAKLIVAVENRAYLDLMQSPLQAALTRTVMPGVLPRTRIEFFEATRDWRWTGTAALALERMYLDDNRNRTGRSRRIESGERNAVLAAPAGV